MLDLGCGPGIYAEHFHHHGYFVTGVDISERSIEYAKDNANVKELNITYLHQDYLDLKCNKKFDVITLIYCDFGVLSDNNRKSLLSNIYNALNPNGTLIFDVFTSKQHENKQERTDWSYSNGGFWNKDPHVCLNSFHRYDESNTILNQTIVITDKSIESYNIWEHTFTPNQLKGELTEAGFTNIDIYGDIAGADYSNDSNIICAVAKIKEN